MRGILWRSLIKYFLNGWVKNNPSWPKCYGILHIIDNLCISNIILIMNRREFLKVVGIGGLFTLLSGKISKLFAGVWEHKEGKNYWSKGYFIQNNVKVEKEKIKAKINGKWKIFSPKELPEEFLKWNFEKRIKDIEGIKKGKFPSLAGPHNAAVATYGAGRNDTQFTLNNAIKGTGFVPKENRIEEIINKMQNTINSPMPEKLAFLKELYKKGREIFDLKKQVSLELYTTKNFETHTFLNIMENPVATIVYLDIPSYELRTIVRIIHPEDHSASWYEKKILKYTNLVHSYFHGKFPRLFPVLIFHVIEVFDNSPGDKRGIRIVPPH